METDCCNRLLADSQKVKKENALLSRLVEVCTIPFRSRDDRFYRYIGVNFTCGLLDCDRFIGDIVMPGSQLNQDFAPYILL